MVGRSLRGLEDHKGLFPVYKYIPFTFGGVNDLTQILDVITAFAIKLTDEDVALAHRVVACGSKVEIA